MRHHDVIELLSVSIVADDLGNQIQQETSRQVFANEFDISSAEFYQAGVQGLKPEKRFEIYSFEYRNESKFRYDGVVYRIIRTQQKGEKIRLTGEKVIANG
jgi:SPP1 family predicted phage head-tail adaptor